MRTTIRIDDDLMRELKQRSQHENASLTDLVNRILRRGLAASEGGHGKTKRRYREKVYSLGVPRVPLDKALALAAAMEDAEVIEEMARRK